MANINFLGDFDSIQEVWATLPSGGNEGDYLTVNGNTLSWNKFIRQWQNSNTVISTPSRETQTHDGNYNVGNDMIIGGDLKVVGKIINDSIHDGKSAYELWREEEGNENKTESEFWAFLTADKGFTKQVKTYAEFQLLDPTTAPTNVIYVYPNSDGTEYYSVISNGTIWVELLHNDGDITTLSNDVNTIKESVSDIDEILNGNEYIPEERSKSNKQDSGYFRLNIPILNGESVTITLLENDVDTGVSVFGKTTDDYEQNVSNYQTLASDLVNVLDSNTVTANRDITYIKVINASAASYQGTVKVRITIDGREDSLGLIDRMTKCEDDISELEGIADAVNDVSESVDELNTILNGEQSSYVPDVLSKNKRYGDYTELNNPISNGESVKITVLTNDVGSVVSVYGRTNLDDSSYQTLTSNLQTEGDSITVVADRDINYVRVVSSEGEDVDYDQLVSVKIELNRDEGLEKGLVERVSDLESQSGDSFVVAKMYNPPINFKKSPLRVLDIGNSFSQDAQTITGFISAANIDLSDFCLYTAVKSGATFKSWLDIYHGSGLSYFITKSFGGYSQGDNIEGDAEAGDSSLFVNLLTNCEWDIIIIHQASDYSMETLETWEGNVSGGKLKEFLRIIRTLQPSASIGFLFTHASNKLSPVNPDSETKKLTTQTWALMASVIKDFSKSYGVDFIIPVGTAIENLRASSLNTTNYNFSQDNHHLASGLAKYVAGATYFMSILGRKYGKTVYNSSYNTTSITPPEGDYANDMINVSPQNATKAQMCAILALNDMWNINNPDGIEL